MKTMNTPTREEEGAAIWTPVVGLRSGETVKLRGCMTHAQACETAQIETDRLAAQGKAVEWSGARRVAATQCA